MKVRHAHIDDITRIMEIYAIARDFMRETGNGNQWINGYPSEELIRKSIEEGDHYVCICEDQIAGTFYFRIGEDDTYFNIYEGEWLNDKPYGVIHRLASGRKYKGIGDFCMQWCFEQIGNIRVDTHRENIVMQTIFRKNGYVPCGIIFIHNGTERLAFQKSSDRI